MANRLHGCGQGHRRLHDWAEGAAKGLSQGDRVSDCRRPVNWGSGLGLKVKFQLVHQAVSIEFFDAQEGAGLADKRQSELGGRKKSTKIR